MLILYILLIPVASVYTICTEKPEPTCGQNASYVDCPTACPATCKSPNEGNCNKKCEPKGCRCNPSYLLSKPKGECILPKDCPGGNPCPQNETFVACNIGCPTNYCPVNDNLATLICDPAWQCPSGCFCKQNYKRRSVKDPRCILASECPPLKCTRPNEEWNSCTNSCLRENCYNLKESHISCKPWGCEPRCACKHGFYRNDSRICVPASQCFPEDTCDIKPECKRTCAQPNPENCSYETVTENVKGCKCKPGFILSDKDGDCIEIEKCPQQLGCNNDPNAVVTSCPPPCPATCQSPRDAPCKKMCLDVGCRCKTGFILSKLSGLCIKPENCTGGDPCGKNATFSSCSNRCPYNYCPKDDSPTNYDCLPESPCPAGCICKLNHRRKSLVEDRCILTSDCPPVNCTRPNEVWNSCPSACLKEKCEDAGKQPTVCNTLVLNCQPNCVCKPNTYRNKNKVCVPVDKCPAPPPIKCGVNEEYSKCKIKCPPQFCNNSYTDYGICPNVTKCEPGCNCIKDHLRDFKGNCVLNDNCPPPPTPCGGNATSTDCASACPPTCETPKPEICIDLCKPNVTCQCLPSYVLSPNGDCILPEDCPAPPPPVCSENEVSIICKTRCTSDSCDSEKPKGFCRPGPCRRDCICKEGYARDSNGKCIPKEKCPKIPTPCGANATHTDCASSCPPTCQTTKPGICPAVCKPNVQCKCKPSYVLSPKGDCILPKDCPAPCGGNKTYTDCASSCPRTCESPKPGPCAAVCKPNVTCQCKPSYVLSPKGDCILPQDCPAPNPCGGNKTYTDCASSCPPTCESPKPGVCAAVCKPNVTCQCKPSYVVSPNGDCILPEDCPAPPPPVCGENEVSIVCKTWCTSDSCDAEKPKGFCRPGPCRRGCICKEGYARDANGKCIPKGQCPAKPITCGGNATLLECTSACPATCGTPKPQVCITLCMPKGCQCKPSYVLSPKGDCILPEDCPAPTLCGGNATHTDCASLCPPTCQTPKPGICATVCKPNEKCKCKSSYVLSPKGDCILPQDCPAPCGGNKTYTDCASSCPPTCESPKPGPCATVCKPNVTCQCKPSYVLSPKGDCILPQDCPAPNPCGGNKTYTDCASSCPPTCESPKPGVCAAVCKPNVTCQCKPSYVVSPNGDCILPEDCPAPPPPVCGENEISIVCKTWCTSDSCDAEKPNGFCRPGPCRRGCICKEGYARDANGKCIPKDQCPAKPITCGGNATLLECTSACPATCGTPKPQVCITLCMPKGCQCKPSYVLSPKGDCILPEDCPAPTLCGGNATHTDCASLCPPTCQTPKPGICATVCKPNEKCKCKSSYVLSPKGNCILPQDCPAPCGGNKTYTDCASSCPPTCESPKPGPCAAVCKPNVTCQCKPGYVLSPNGECILLQDCPAPPTCGSNATLVDCASSCPSTCQTPDPQSCIAKCISNSCQCKPSYILSKPKGECILPVDCPGGTPCSPNATFSSCNVKCPNSYCPVDDRQGIIICDPPRPCRSGCSCKLNYKLKSIKEPQCILAEECPPVKCTRPNEEWNTCPTSCLKENCEDLKLTKTACKPSRTNCQPRCACKEGFYRNSSRLCVPASECSPSKKCDISNECKATCANPNPKNCPYQPATENVEGCKCKPGYVLSDKNGECIRIQECPVETGCNGDSNAIITKCPPPCPSTCDSPNETPCKKSCLPVGCKCKDGFILSKINGLCIKPENCTGGNPCKNGVFSTCTNKCPYNYCPINDSPPDYNCTATSPCRSGCVCRFNHKKKSMTEEQCILASDCPPVNCTRPNEVWDSCPSACLNEGCENAGKKTPICYTLILNCDPRCVCKPNTYKDKNKVCVPVDQCPTPPVVCGENEVETCKFDDDDTELSVCKPTCDCKENYSRDSSGQCVPDTPCPPNTCDVPPECRRTCAKPNPKNCSSQEVSENENGCKCKPGYILLDRHGECVKIEECPSDLGCNGDINALVSQCPPPCPSTCSGPNEILCRKACLDVGCKCKEGFILSELNGRCIPPDECKGGNPCGKNATFSSCSNRCSYNYCPKDDSPPNYNCALPYRCPSGCVCNLNYRRKSIDDRQCILASECPPVNCTRPNEVWDSCPSDCLQEKCEDAGKLAVPCDTFVLNCQPNCVCKKNTYRNKDKICVPVNKCPKKKPIPCDPIPINY